MAAEPTRPQPPPPSGDFLYVWFDGTDPNPGYVVGQCRAVDGRATTVDELATFPSPRHAIRQLKGFNPAAPRYRRSANRYARLEAQSRNLPVWTAREEPAAHRSGASARAGEGAS